MRALAESVAAARARLRQTHAGLAPVTHHPQSDLLRLMAEYASGERACRARIDAVLAFAERFVRALPAVPPLDDFRDLLLPAAAASSARVLQDVATGVRALSTFLFSFPPPPSRERRAQLIVVARRQCPRSMERCLAPRTTSYALSIIFP